MSTRSNEHVSAERLQAFLDEALSQRERARIEEHVAGCARCSEELESWHALFEDLAALPQHGPRAGFGARVMTQVAVRAPASLAERLRRGLLAVLPSPRPEHPTGERLQDFLDGALPPRQVARVASHLDACAACAAEADAWRPIYARLGKLDALAPSAGFADRVMAGVRLPTAAPASATPSRAPILAGLGFPDWRGVLVAVGRFVPKTRRAWAALAGVALTPAVTAGLVIYTVFSHPTLTPQALASFVFWEVSDLLAAGWGAFASFALDAGQVLGVDAVVRTLFDAPFMLAGGALAYSAIAVLALRVLYKNLLSSRRYARLSHS